MDKNNHFSFWKLIQKYVITIPPIQRDYAQGRAIPRVNLIRKKLIKDMIEACLLNQEPLDLGFVYGTLEEFGLTETAMAKASRNQLLESLKAYMSILGDDTLIELASPEPEQTKESGNQLFIPLDGQQRLTTLFLFHLYVYSRAGAEEAENEQKIFKNFQYKTRPSSDEFITFLLAWIFEENKKNRPFEEALAEQIKQQEGYFNRWSHDPTVKGMLKMLDDIHREFEKKEDLIVNPDFKAIWKRLTDEVQSPFKFIWMDLEKLKQGDELYVKMNARGKELTIWENFKATLTHELEKNSEHAKFVTGWTSKLDIEWADEFWRLGGKNRADDLYLNYFKHCFLIDQLKQSTAKDLSDKSHLVNQQMDMLRKKENTLDLLGILLPTVQEKDKQNMGVYPHIASYFELLDIFQELKAHKEALFQDFPSHYFAKKSDNQGSQKKHSFDFYDYFLKKEEPSFSDYAVFYALNTYLLKIGIPLEQEASEKNRANNLATISGFSAYCQVICNLIFNANYYNDLNDLRRVLFNIEALIEGFKDYDPVSHHALGFYQFMSTASELSFLKVGNSHEQHEEVIKAKIITQASQLEGDETLWKAWENTFRQYEANPYFYGQIQFLLSRIDEDAVAHQMGHRDSFTAFKREGDILQALFSNAIEGVHDENNPLGLLRRGLLIEGDYSVKGRYEENKTLIPFKGIGAYRTLQEGWRLVFNDKDKQAILFDLVTAVSARIAESELEISPECVEDALKSHIEEKDLSKITDYRYLILDEPRVFKGCHSLQMRPYHENRYLLPSVQLSGKYRELHSYYLYLKLNEKKITETQWLINNLSAKVSYHSYNAENYPEPYLQIEFVDHPEMKIYQNYESGDLVVSTEGKDIPILIKKAERVGHYPSYFELFLEKIEKRD